MVNLCNWYNQHVAIRIPGDDRVFKTQIMWVHDLPPKTVEFVQDGKIVTLTSYISPELVNISVVFLLGRLPPYFNTTAPSCLALDAETGEWFCHRGNERVPITVEIVDKK